MLLDNNLLNDTRIAIHPPAKAGGFLASQGKEKGKKKLPWRFSHVTYAMVEPPDKDVKGWASAMLRGHWRDEDAHDFYTKTAPAVRYKGANYQRIITVAELLQYIERGDAVRFEFLPKAGFRVLAKTTDRTVVKGTIQLVKTKGMVLGYPITRSKRWRFTTSYKLTPRQTETWDVDPKNLLKAHDAYNEDVKVGKISWHPNSGELLLAPEYEQHAITIHNQGSHPFDEYVRLIVLHDKNKVLARPWSPTGSLEYPDARAQSFEAQYAAKEMLERAGMPKSWKFEMDTSNPRLERLTGRRRW